MFSRNKDSREADKLAVQMPAPMSAPQPAAPNPKRPAVRAAPSIISTDLVVHGNLVATGDIQIDGTVEGDIRSQSVTVGEKASINGEIVAEDIVIRGRVIGTIRGRRVQLSSTSHVEGDILHEALAVETGAFFEGNCRHSDDPISHPTSTPRQQAVRPSPSMMQHSSAPRPAVAPSPRPAEHMAAPLAAPTAQRTAPATPGDTTVIVTARPAAQ